MSNESVEVSRGFVGHPLYYESIFYIKYQLMNVHSFFYLLVHSLDSFIQSYIYSIHSLRSPSCDRSTVFSTASSPQSAIKVRPFSSYSIFSFPYSHSVGTYVFFILFPSLLSFHDIVLEGRSYANVTYPVSIPYFYCIQHVPFLFDPMLKFFIFLHEDYTAFNPYRTNVENRVSS